jgi:PAS domain-containing protein
MDIPFSPKRTALLYFAIGLCWIVLSDVLADYLLTDTGAFIYISIIKGTLFAAFTALLIYAITQSCNRQLQTSQEDLEAAQLQYKLLFENNPIPMWVYELKTHTFLMVNNAAIATYGYTKEQFLSKNLFDIGPAEDYQLLADNLSKDTDSKYYVFRCMAACER